MPNDNLKKLKELLDTASVALIKDGFLKEFREEFLASTKTIISHILKVEEKLIERVDNAIKNINSQQDALKKATESDLRGITAKFEQSINNLLKQQENALKRFEEMEQGKQGEPGKDAVIDESKIVADVLAKLPKVDEEDIEIKDVKGLKEELDRLEAMKLKGGRGGGVSALGVQQAFKWILKTEQPSGLINGVNLEYTVTQPIFAVLAFSLNGEVVAQLPNYTISGKKITFSTALPADYSGKDFEIKYV
jgi:flagellar hook-basal body complex protein FliE